MQISSTKPAIAALAALVIVAAHLAMSHTVSAHSRGGSLSHSGGIGNGAMGNGAMSAPLHSSAGPALQRPDSGSPSTIPGATSPTPAAPHAATAPATQTAQHGNAFVNPNTCNPETSTQCAVEDLELQELQTPTKPAPKLFKQPAPASPDMLGLPAPNTPMDILDSPITEQPNELSGGGTRTQAQQSGAGGPTLADCMSNWDPTTDMSKSEWKATCIRTLNGIDLPTEGVADTTAPRHLSPNAGANGR